MDRSHESSDGRHARSAVALVLACLVSACVAQQTSMQGADDLAASAEELITAYLRAQGFDVSTLRFDGDQVIVEHDMAFSRQTLLEDAQATTPKAYISDHVHANRTSRGRIYTFNDIGCLFYASNVPRDWRDALNAAAAQWRAVGIDLRGDDICNPIGHADVLRVAVTYEDFGPADVSTVARGTIGYPFFGRPVQINSGFRNAGQDEEFCGGGGSEEIPQDIKLGVSLHEIGHTIGLAHPGEGRALEGTDSSFTVDSVMMQGCAHARSTLSDDDKRAAQVLLGGFRLPPGLD